MEVISNILEKYQKYLSNIRNISAVSEKWKEYQQNACNIREELENLTKICGRSDFILDRK
jgi:hypothetical protein